MAAEQQSTKSLDVCGIGDAIFDAITYISEEELKSLGWSSDALRFKDLGNRLAKAAACG